MYSLSEATNLEILKDLVDDHKMIEVYVENGKTRLEFDEMSSNSIKTVIVEVGTSKKNEALAVVQYCSQKLFLENIVKKPVAPAKAAWFVRMSKCEITLIPFC